MAKKSAKRKIKPSTVASLFTAARLAAGFDARYKMARAISDSLGSEELRYYATIRNIETGITTPSIVTLNTLLNLVGWEATVTFQPKRNHEQNF